MSRTSFYIISRSIAYLFFYFPMTLIDYLTQMKPNSILSQLSIMEWKVYRDLYQMTSLLSTHFFTNTPIPKTVEISVAIGRPMLINQGIVYI